MPTISTIQENSNCQFDFVEFVELVDIVDVSAFVRRDAQRVSVTLSIVSISSKAQPLSHSLFPLHFPLSSLIFHLSSLISHLRVFVPLCDIKTLRLAAPPEIQTSKTGDPNIKKRVGVSEVRG